MQQDHVLKTLKVDLLKFEVLPQSPGWGWGSTGKYLLPCCCNHDYFYFDIQHDPYEQVLEKMNFDLLTATPGWAG